METVSDFRTYLASYPFGATTPMIPQQSALFCWSNTSPVATAAAPSMYANDDTELFFESCPPRMKAPWERPKEAGAHEEAKLLDRGLVLLPSLRVSR